MWEGTLCIIALFRLAELCLMQIGDVAEGIIQSIKPYGAFVDLGKGLSGLLHISQISYDRITNVGSILSEGDKLKVCVAPHCTIEIPVLLSSSLYLGPASSQVCCHRV